MPKSNKKVNLSIFQIEQIKALYEKRIKVSTVAKTIGICETTLRRQLERTDIIHPSQIADEKFVSVQFPVMRKYRRKFESDMLDFIKKYQSDYEAKKSGIFLPSKLRSYEN